ncbi:hypothetical protein H696_00837 [Fonticula alba]|uniref:Polynucleotide kinase 3'-phosphatase n=1 Tax=Fonticula alba TaxID=691883 RepID=A0A058ZIF2_FONAL|nr:hypothetical protein H696_00837 [Fonticula alba]KCV73297.1 hypothetical protein H696_00837 [Fonticula alba]|eukprot:XP_009492998.1 hypothetical protein H696_00837 [Fonticula alba]
MKRTSPRNQPTLFQALGVERPGQPDKSQPEKSQSDKCQHEKPRTSRHPMFWLPRETSGTLIYGESLSLEEHLRRAAGKGAAPKPLRVAAFDMDFTLIRPHRGTYPRGPSDWVFLTPEGQKAATGSSRKRQAPRRPVTTVSRDPKSLAALETPLRGAGHLSEVRDTLQALHSAGWLVAIFSNQFVSPDMEASHRREMRTKLEDIASHIDIPFCFSAALSRDGYRKPCRGMWLHFVARMADTYGLEIDQERSFFVGDAAGRPSDHSAADRLFAANNGLPFFLPEEIFFGTPVVPELLVLRHFEPRSFPKSGTPEHRQVQDRITALTQQGAPAAGAELVLLVGPPASGKSTFARRYFRTEDVRSRGLGGFDAKVPVAGSGASDDAPAPETPARRYLRVNQDLLKSREACIRLTDRLLTAGHSVVVDNTNPDRATREAYLAIATRLGVPARAFVLGMPDGSADEGYMLLSQHLNLYRLLRGDTDGDPRDLVPRIAFNIFSSKFQHPSVADEPGLTSVAVVPFLPDFAPAVGPADEQADLQDTAPSSPLGRTPSSWEDIRSCRERLFFEHLV